MYSAPVAYRTDALTSAFNSLRGTAVVYTLLPVCLLDEADIGCSCLCYIDVGVGVGVGVGVVG